MEICGQFIQLGEFEEICDRFRSDVERIVQQRGTLQDRMKGEIMIKACDLLAIMVCREVRSGILVNAVPVYNLGIVDRHRKASAGAAPEDGPAESPNSENDGGW